jgi:hypothetical protein
VCVDEPDLAAAITARLAKFVKQQAGVARPIGDRYAVSLIPIAVLLVAENQETVESLLRQTTMWVCDRYERDELGLASIDAPEFEEVCRVLAGPFDVGLARRQESQVASVLLDVSATLDLRDVYADVRNDTLAVELYPSVPVLADGRTSYPARRMGTAGITTPTTPTRSMARDQRLRTSAATARSRSFPMSAGGTLWPSPRPYETATFPRPWPREQRRESGVPCRVHARSANASSPGRPTTKSIARRVACGRR